MLIRLPKLKFVIMTLGEHGCVMLERCSSEVSGSEEETDIDELHESLKQSTDFTSVLPVCNSSVNNVFRYIISSQVLHFVNENIFNALNIFS
jgi:hypothetical protein